MIHKKLLCKQDAEELFGFIAIIDQSATVIFIFT